MSTRKVYTAEARPWAEGWELHIDGVGVTQCRGITDAASAVRDYISTLLELPATSFDVRVLWSIPYRPEEAT